LNFRNQKSPLGNTITTSVPYFDLIKKVKVHHGYSSGDRAKHSFLAYLLIVSRAGVAGLTTALVLARKGYKVMVVAKHMPGDLSIEYTSPWAVFHSNYLSHLIQGSKLVVHSSFVPHPL
jgi:hypothetical protein